MTLDLAPLVDLISAWLSASFLVFLRVGAALATAPGLGEQSIPVRFRLVLGLAMTVIVGPAIGSNAIPDSTLEIAKLCGAEVGTGLFLGILVRLFVLSLQTAGAIAAQSTSLSQLFGGTAGADPQPAMAHMLVVGGLALAMMLGLHVQITVYLIQSYTIIPQGAGLSPQTVASLGVDHISKTFGMAYSIAAPFLIASLIYNVALGVINRAMPQLMVAFVGAPAITAGGLMLFLVASPLMISVWHGAMTVFLSSFGAVAP